MYSNVEFPFDKIASTLKFLPTNPPTAITPQRIDPVQVRIKEIEYNAFFIITESISCN